MTQAIHVAAVVVVTVLVILWYCSYYAAYTIDYLMNRHTYIFKEEGSHSANNFTENSHSILQNYMKQNRKMRLDNLDIVPAESIPELDIADLTSENVRKISDGFSKPFVVRGLIRDFDCVKKWDLDYFEREFGNVELLAFANLQNNTKYGETEVYKSTSSSSPDNGLCSIKEVCDCIRKGKPLYVNNISKLFAVSNKARSELNLDRLNNMMKNRFFMDHNKDYQFFSQLFLGGKNTGTSLHCSSNINFFFNIKGQKKWGFIDPKYSSYIHCQTSENGLYASSFDDYFSDSSANPFLRIPRQETVLNSGDFLFNPSWYWHAVKNLSDYTIAVANRCIRYDTFGGELTTIQNNYFFTFLQLFSPVYYSQFFNLKETDDPQLHFGNIVDGEIINNIHRKQVL